jgi:aflatoxin B1 aldehyde reductase
LRWVQHNSALKSELGDAMIVGASSAEQLEKTLLSCEKGALPKEVADAISECWGTVREGAPSYTPFEAQGPKLG